MSAPATAPAPPDAFRAPPSAELDARFFRGLGDPTRLRIVELLLDGERTVSDIVRELGVQQGRISSHLT